MTRRFDHATAIVVGLCLLAALAFCAKGRAEVSVTFSPQPSDPRLPAITIWAVSNCTNQPQPRSLPAGVIYQATLGHFTYVQPAEVRRIANAKRQRSIPHGLAVTGEFVSVGVTSALAVEGLKIKEKAKNFIPIGVPLFDLGRRALAREFPPWELPANTLQPWIALPPSGCNDGVIFGRTQSLEVPFVVKLD